jgi:hypothetical protein
LAYWPIWYGGGVAMQLSDPGGWGVTFKPQYALFHIVNAAIAGGPALALFLVPRAYRWFLDRTPLRSVAG